MNSCVDELFLLKLTSEELSILRKALLGKLTDPEHIAKAKELNEKIVDQLLNNFETQLSNMKKRFVKNNH